MKVKSPSSSSRMPLVTKPNGKFTGSGSGSANTNNNNNNALKIGIKSLGRRSRSFLSAAEAAPPPTPQMNLAPLPMVKNQSCNVRLEEDRSAIEVIQDEDAPNAGADDADHPKENDAPSSSSLHQTKKKTRKAFGVLGLAGGRGRPPVGTNNNKAKTKKRHQQAHARSDGRPPTRPPLDDAKKKDLDKLDDDAIMTPPTAMKKSRSLKVRLAFGKRQGSITNKKAIVIQDNEDVDAVVDNADVAEDDVPKDAAPATALPSSPIENKKKNNKKKNSILREEVLSEKSLVTKCEEEEDEEKEKKDIAVQTSKIGREEQEPPPIDAISNEPSPSLVSELSTKMNPAYVPLNERLEKKRHLKKSANRKKKKNASVPSTTTTMRINLLTEMDSLCTPIERDCACTIDDSLFTDSLVTDSLGDSTMMMTAMDNGEDSASDLLLLEGGDYGTEGLEKNMEESGMWSQAQHFISMDMICARIERLASVCGSPNDEATVGNETIMTEYLSLDKERKLPSSYSWPLGRKEAKSLMDLEDSLDKQQEFDDALEKAERVRRTALKKVKTKASQQLKQTKTRAHTKIASYADELKWMKHQVDQESTKNQALADEIEKLKKENEVLNENEAQVDVLKQEIMMKRNASERTIESLKGEVQTLKSQIDSLRQNTATCVIPEEDAEYTNAEITANRNVEVYRMVKTIEALHGNIEIERKLCEKALEEKTLLEAELNKKKDILEKRITGVEELHSLSLSQSLSETNTDLKEPSEKMAEDFHTEQKEASDFEDNSILASSSTGSLPASMNKGGETNSGWLQVMNEMISGGGSYDETLATYDTSVVSNEDPSTHRLQRKTLEGWLNWQEHASTGRASQESDSCTETEAQTQGKSVISGMNDSTTYASSEKGSGNPRAISQSTSTCSGFVHLTSPSSGAETGAGATGKWFGFRRHKSQNDIPVGRSRTIQ